MSTVQKPFGLAKEAGAQSLGRVQMTKALGRVQAVMTPEQAQAYAAQKAAEALTSQQLISQGEPPICAAAINATRRGSPAAPGLQAQCQAARAAAGLPPRTTW
jgi:hypothetical protein